VLREANKEAKAAEAAATAAAIAEVAAAAAAAGIPIEETKTPAKKKKGGKEGNEDDELPTLPTTVPVTRTPIHAFFSGVLQNTVECLTCHSISTTSEPFFDLSLPIDPPFVPKKKVCSIQLIVLSSI
jgi:nitrate reductase cytochrome c-type subunit